MLTDNNCWCNNSELYYQNDNLLHLFSLHEELRNEILNYKPKTILDFGSGAGKLLKSLEINDNFEITLFDIEKSAIEMAKYTYSNKTIITSNEKDLKPNYYDVVICSNVLMCIPTESEIQSIFKRMTSAKKDNGVLIIGITHPCFLDRNFQSFNNDYSLNKQEFNYFLNGNSYNVFVNYKNNEAIIKDYFWNLSFIINTALKVGLRIIAFDEIKTNESNYPPYLLIKFT